MTHLKLPRPFFLFCAYMAILILLPGGTLLGFNFKMLIFVPLVIVTVREVTGEAGGLRQIAIGTAIIAALTFWIFLAQIYNFFDIKMSLAQYRDVAASLIGCWFVRIFTQTRRDREFFIRLCLYGTAFLGLVKIGIFSYSMLTGVSTASVMGAISRAFGVQLMTFELGDALGRIQLSSDTLIPVCLFTVLCLRRQLNIRSLESLGMVALLIASSVFTFSRFLWGYTAFAALLGIVVSKRDKMHWLYLSVSTVAVGFYFNALALLVQLRFSQEIVDSSDSDRVLQSGALQRFFVDAPLFGHGFGTYTNVVIRQPDLPYNYEMQLLALCTQVGIVGMLFMASLMVVYYAKAFTFAKGSRTYQSAVFILLLTFLVGGLFNPSVVSSIAATTYGLLFALAATDCCAEKAAWPARPRTAALAA